MRLTDLHPELWGTTDDGTLMFDCPLGKCSGGPCMLQVKVSALPYHERDPRADEQPSGNGKVKVWQASGQFPDSLSLSPSIDIQDGKGATMCWHGHVTNGEIR